MQLTKRERIAWAIVAGILAAAYVVLYERINRQFGPGASDFDQLWFAARALWRGADTYALIGPGKPYDWPWPLVYPLSTVVAVLPFSALPLLFARVLFVSLSAGTLAYGLAGRARGVL